MTNINENLDQEAKAFDHQIDDRIKNGHIPDISFSQPCDYFYNNPWRRPEYVKLDFGEQFEIIRNAILRYVQKDKAPRVLEVGCGPGYLTLELARSNMDVVGVDLSNRCIEIARKFADMDPIKERRSLGSEKLQYFCGDFYTMPQLEEKSFDAVVFLGALHHFPDQEATLKRAKSLLVDGGIVIAHEPVRDRVSQGNAAFVHLLRVLLSLNGGFYKSYKPTIDKDERAAEIEALFNEMRYELEDGEKAQSVNDNEAGYAEMYPVLSTLFSELCFEWRYAFFHEFIGGLRLGEQENFTLARYLRDMDKELCRLGVLQATEFFYVGRKL